MISLFCFRDCPNDINEAVSSLVFASARLGDLPELPVIRKLFGERYGKKFVTSALELLPGNLVNYQVCPQFTLFFFLENYRKLIKVANFVVIN